MIYVAAFLLILLVGAIVLLNVASKRRMARLSPFQRARVAHEAEHDLFTFQP